MMAPCVTSRLQVRGQGLVMHVYDMTGRSGSRLVFVHLATREETGDRIPVIDERREWRWKEVLSGTYRSVCVFTGWTGLLADVPAEVLRYLQRGTVEVLAEWVHLSGSNTDLRSGLAVRLWSNWQQKRSGRKKQIVTLTAHPVAGAAPLRTRFATWKYSA